MNEKRLDVSWYGERDADTILIQMVGDHETDGLSSEYEDICRISGRSDFCLAAVRVNDWNADLSPWPAPAVFGKEDFGNGAKETFDTVLDQFPPGRKYYIGGYSLAGLFALWAVYQSDLFEGAAAASPSVWFPGFLDYMQDNTIRTNAVYLSLGDKEAKTRNPVMSRVADAIEKAQELLLKSGIECTLEWNQGNHFREPGLRMAKGFAWLLREEA